MTTTPAPLAPPPPAEPAAPRPSADRPTLTELRLSAFAGHRGTTIPLAPLTFLAGPSGSGKTSALRACAALAQLASGTELADVFPDPAAWVPETARADAGGRRGFRIGCTVDGPSGPVRLDLAVQAEPELRIVGERLSRGSLTLLETALRDPGRRCVQAAWHTAGAAPVTRGPLPDDLLGTALLPLRVAGKTAGQRAVLAAAEQTVVALRSFFPCDPQPRRMRRPVPYGTGRLLPGCDNLAEVLHRTRHECAIRYGHLVRAANAGCAGRTTDVRTEEADGRLIRAVLDRGDGLRTPVDRLGDGELRYLALALVLLTGPGVLEVDPAAEVPEALQALTVLADGFDRGLDRRQFELLRDLAVRTCARGHIRLLATVTDASWAAGGGSDGGDGPVGVSVVDLGR